MPNLQKREYVAQITEKLQSNGNFIVVSLSATTHQQLEEFRTELRKLNEDISETPQFMILKNSLFKIAFGQLNKQDKLVSNEESEKLQSEITGQTALMMLPTDWVGGLKAFKDFAKNIEGMQFKVGIIDGEIHFEGGLKQLADLPTKEELVVRLIMAMKASQSRMVYGLQFNTMKLINVLKNAGQKEN